MLNTTNLIATLSVFFFATSFVTIDAQAQGNKRISNQRKVGSKSGGKSKQNKSTGKSSQPGGRSQGLSKTHKSPQSQLNAASQGVAKKVRTGITTPRETATGAINTSNNGELSESRHGNRNGLNARFKPESSKSSHGTAAIQRASVDCGDVVVVRELDAYGAPKDIRSRITNGHQNTPTGNLPQTNLPRANQSDGGQDGGGLWNSSTGTMFRGGGGIFNDGATVTHQSPFFGQDQETGEIIDFRANLKLGTQTSNEPHSLVDSEGWDEVPEELMFSFRAGRTDRRSGFGPVKPNHVANPRDAASGLPTGKRR